MIFEGEGGELRRHCSEFHSIHNEIKDIHFQRLAKAPFSISVIKIGLIDESLCKVCCFPGALLTIQMTQLLA